ncbi:rhodanese-like domain-containing protein [Streptomyces sp. NPDC056061]|uniref:rhodanese-like domain-containing protein n=1 Tax=Streptomyces sp. NPDC056061 TaxID=3345700 RepID=UPI0035DB7BFB
MNTTPAPAATIAPAVLHRLLQEGRAPRLLDVRTPGEFRTMHIPGSCNVPLATLREHRAKLLAHLDEDVVLVCRSGTRAGQAAKILAEAGLTGLPVLDGGIVAWETAGAPVDRGTERWDMERQVRLVAGSIVLTTSLVGVLVPGVHLIGTAVGAGLTYAALSNSCAMGVMLSKLPYNRGPRPDIRKVIAQLSTS